MHPMMIKALANEMARERRSEWRKSAIRSVALADNETGGSWFQELRAVGELGWRLRVVSSLRARIS